MDEISQRFSKLWTTEVSDAMDQLGIDGVVQDLKQVISDSKLFGWAFTVKEIYHGPKEQAFDISTILKNVSADQVVVIDVRGRSDASTWGGNASAAAKAKGVRGALIDGACRDIDEIRAIDFPVFARAWVPRTGRDRIATVGMNIPVQIKGVTVNPNDFVLADSTGVVIVPHDNVKEILSKAEKIGARDKTIQREVRTGKDVSEVY